MPQSLYNALGEYIDLLLDAVCVVDKEGHFQFLSTGAERIFGFPVAEMLGRSMLDFIHPDDIQKTLNAAAAINAGQLRLDFENRYIRKDGQIVYLLWSARWSADKQQRVAVARDITKLKRAESRQRALYAISEAAFAAEDLAALYAELLAIVQQLMPIDACVIARLSDNGQMSIPYQYFDDVAKNDVREAQQFCLDLLSCRQHSVLPATFNSESGAIWLGVPLTSHKETLGALVVMVSQQTASHNKADAELLAFVAQHMAIAIERKELLARLQHSALYDDLTHLPKRALFYDRCELALAAAKRSQSLLAICYLDLDGFKPVNDRFGHAVGDELLQQVALRLQNCVRQSDTVARFGGDEFVLLLTDVPSIDAVVNIVDKVRQRLVTAFDICSETVLITPSIGVAIYPKDKSETAELLTLADQAMYRAKNAGGNCVIVA